MSDSINPRINHQWSFNFDTIAELATGITSGDINALSKAITLSDSRKQLHQEQTAELLDNLHSHWVKNNSLRIGITGPPGVGKSTFIERIGSKILDGDNKLAILPVDPTSVKTKGSILGDKTRMQELSQQRGVFIRPNPSGEHLGGMAATTCNAILLCEGAGFYHIILESVGVGQSEIEVQDLADLIIVLLQPGSGDALQGIKKGVMEIADLIIVHKMDGDLKQSAKQKISSLRQLYPSKTIIGVSSLEGLGLTEVTTLIQQQTSSTSKRQNQLRFLIQKELENQLLHHFRSHPGYKSLIESQHVHHPIQAGRDFIQRIQSNSY